MNEQVQWPGVICVKHTEHCMCAIWELTIIIIITQQTQNRCIPFVQCWTLGRRCTNSIHMLCVYWVKGVYIPNVVSEWILLNVAFCTSLQYCDRRKPGLLYCILDIWRVTGRCQPMARQRFKFWPISWLYSLVIIWSMTRRCIWKELPAHWQPELNHQKLCVLLPENTKVSHCWFNAGPASATLDERLMFVGFWLTIMMLHVQDSGSLLMLDQRRRWLSNFKTTLTRNLQILDTLCTDIIKKSLNILHFIRLLSRSGSSATVSQPQWLISHSVSAAVAHQPQCLSRSGSVSLAIDVDVADSNSD